MKAAPILPNHDNDEITTIRAKLKREILTNSINITSPNFASLSVNDLKLLVAGLDREVFGRFFSTFPDLELYLSLSNRLKSSAGLTKHSRFNGVSKYRITISTYLMFKAFSGSEEYIIVNGVKCSDRLTVLMVVMEHELLHLFELLTKGSSSCGKAPFKELAFQVFKHTGTKHEINHSQENQVYDFKIGDAVSFRFKDRYVEGKLIRITKRATIMTSRGKFYVPLGQLAKLSK